MNYYILSIDSLVTTFQLIESSSSVLFKLESSVGDNDIFEEIKENDIIFGYYVEPTDGIISIMKVENIEEDGIKLIKLLETSNIFDVKGIVDETEYLSLQTCSNIIAITEEQAKYIYNKIKENELIPTLVNEENREDLFDDEEVLRRAKEIKDKIDNFSTNNIGLPYNWIVYGAPGTGKSFDLNKNVESNFDNEFFERVTFYNRYSYSNFVGAYKPFMYKNEITYGFIPGPFIRILLKAYTNIINDIDKSVCLLIEEINRADPASVFGDVFQLLDRSDGVSEYPIETSIELRDLLCSELVDGYRDLKDINIINQCRDVFNKIRIPANMYIWSTMNSADQGVFPVDTAFKRRWDFKYLDINMNEHLIKDIKFIAPNKEEYDWNEFRKKINDRLRYECRLDEDKLIGPFFISYELMKEVKRDIEGYSPKFNDIFKNKILMYLYEDAGRHFRDTIFKGCKPGAGFSEICQNYDSMGIEIFKFA